MVKASTAAAGRTSRPSSKRQATEELGSAGQQGHEVTRAQAQRVHELARAFQAVAAEGTKQLLRAVGHEDDADGDAQGQRCPAGAGGQQALQGGGGRGVHGGFLKKGLKVNRWMDFKSLTQKDKHAPMRLTVPHMETNHDGPV